MSKQPVIINFSTTANQNMWSSDPAFEIFKEFDIIPVTTIGPRLIDQDFGGLVTLSATVSATYGLKATFQASAGSVAVKYPVNAYIDLPTSIDAGETFKVGTKYFSTATPDLKTTFPNISFSVDLSVTAEV